MGGGGLCARTFNKNKAVSFGLSIYKNFASHSIDHLEHLSFIILSEMSLNKFLECCM